MPDFVVGHSSFTPLPPTTPLAARPALTIREIRQHVRLVELLAKKLDASVEELLQAPEAAVERLRYEAP